MYTFLNSETMIVDMYDDDNFSMLKNASDTDTVSCIVVFSNNTVQIRELHDLDQFDSDDISCIVSCQFHTVLYSKIDVSESAVIVEYKDDSILSSNNPDKIAHLLSFDDIKRVSVRKHTSTITVSNYF